jgi:large subunit ribosomal protein L18
VYKSNTAVYAQLIDDVRGVTIAAVDSRKVKGTTGEGAVFVGTEIANKAKALGVTAVVFDRGGFRYQGIIAALADSARAAGLTF